MSSSDTRHTVEKVGGTSMSHYEAVRDNIVLRGGKGSPYGRVLVVSAYGGITDMLLENKRTGSPGIYGLFAADDADAGWQEALDRLRQRVFEINRELFGSGIDLERANDWIDARLADAERCLTDLQRLCEHGHFALQRHLMTVREMLASIGEAHSAWNTAELLRRDGINTRLVDLSGWNAPAAMTLDEHIRTAFAGIDYSKELPIATGYTYCSEGLMSTFDRGYSEMTFSRIAAITDAREAIIHKEYHLSSADPRLVTPEKVVPMGRTNYDVADQLANLGMEAIHPRAAIGLRRKNLPLRVKNTFEPDHAGTLITRDYVSAKPCVEIIAGRRNVCAIELFDQDMVGKFTVYDSSFMETIKRFKVGILTKDINANTITHYLAGGLKVARRIQEQLEKDFPEAEISVRKVAIVSAIGSDMKVPGLLAGAVAALSDAGISVLAMHQAMRQVDMQFVVNEQHYEEAVRALHARLVEVHDHGAAICAA